MSNTPTLAQLQRGIQISEQIALLQAELASIFAGSPVLAHATVKASPATKADGRSGKRSPETIARMKAAQQARWSKIKTISPLDTLETRALKPGKKGGMSSAGRARIAAAQKRRWAAIKAQKSNGVKAETSSPGAKKTPPAKAQAPMAAAKNRPWYAA